MYKLWDVLFGCSHKRYTFPIMVRHGQQRHLNTSAVRGTYVVCLDCGKEFAYDWREMRVVPPSTDGTSAVREPEIAKPAA